MGTSAHHPAAQPTPNQSLQNKPPREAQPVSGQRLFNLHAFKRFTFPSSFHSFFLRCNNYHVASPTHSVLRQNTKQIQNTKQWRVSSYIHISIFNSCFFHHLTAILAKPELTGKDGNSGVMSHTFLLSFFRWEESQDRMQRNIRRNTLLHGLIVHRLKTLLNQKKKFYPTKGYANGQERKEFGTRVVGKPLHCVKGRGKIILGRKKISQ